MIRPATLAVVALFLSSISIWAKVMNITWEELPALPPSAGQATQPGVAGPFAGVHGDVLIVAGGANFPEKMPWEGGAKIWWDDIWVLEKPTSGPARWVTDKTFKLPRRLGYGISVSTVDGVICAGGHDVDRCYADVFVLSWDPKSREIRRTGTALDAGAAFLHGRRAGGKHPVCRGRPARDERMRCPRRRFGRWIFRGGVGRMSSSGRFCRPGPDRHGSCRWRRRSGRRGERSFFSSAGGSNRRVDATEVLQRRVRV